MEKNPKDIRWRQRFANFERAFQQFQLVLKEDTEHNPLFRAALIQTFEFLFELAWKTLKDKLEAGGVAVQLPRDVVQEAFQAGFISDGRTWLDMLDTRNKLSHLYDEQVSIAAEKKIRISYAPLLTALNSHFRKSL